MKITIVGSGHGIPEAHKQCTATLFETNGRYYFIDAGCDINMALANKRINSEDVKGIFITHPHADHIEGLYPFLTLLGWCFTGANPEVYVPSEKCAALAHFHLEAFGLKLRPEQKLEVYHEGVVFDDGIFRVTAIATQHCPDSHAFLIEAEGKRVLCSGDLKHPHIDFPDVDNLDAAIVEGAHFPVTEYIEVLKNKNIKAVYLNHYGNYYGQINVEKFLKLQEALSPTPAHITTDGFEINL